MSKKFNPNSDSQKSSTHEGPSAEEKLIAQVTAEARKAAGVEGTPKQKNTQPLQQEEDQEGVVTQEGERTEESASDDAALQEDTAQEQIADLSDRLARALAEVENTRRRFQREKQDALRYGASQLAMDVFEVADNLQRARAFVSAEAMEKDANLKNLVLGISMTEKALEEALQRNQIVAIVPKKGDLFSATEQQALSEVASEEVAEGAVIELLQRGYRMGERLLRPAQVIIAKSKEAEHDKDNNKDKNEDPSKSDDENNNNDTSADEAEVAEAMEENSS